MVRRRHYRRAPRGLRPYVRSWASRWRSVPASVLRFCARCSPTIPAACRRCRTGVEIRATLAHDAAADEYREAIVKRWGGRALVGLAFAITAARICPTVKYALGHGKGCMRVVVGGAPVIFDHGG